MPFPTTPRSDSYFDRAAFARLAESEPGHFWFEERNRLIGWALRRYFPAVGSFCEVGCGTGFVLQAIAAEFPGLTLIGVDVFPEGLAFARRRVARARLLCSDLFALSLDEAVDVVGAFDILEHIPDDTAALTRLRDLIRPGGGLLLTVPQHPFLWSIADDIGHHQRRYTRNELRQKVEAAGFSVLRLTSFMFFPLPALWWNRRRACQRERVLAELRPSRPVNGLLHGVLRLERGLIRAGADLPAGGSLLLAARRA
jgi:SAM-dependent methyltransferase